MDDFCTQDNQHPNHAKVNGAYVTDSCKFGLVDVPILLLFSPVFSRRQKEIEPVKDESAQRFKDLQEEFTLYEAARKDPKQASEQVERSLGYAARLAHRSNGASVAVLLYRVVS